MGKMILVTGGTRSGKSSVAENLCKEYQMPVIYLATGEPFDEEMADRIRKHRLSRPNAWKTVEAYRGLGDVIEQLEGARLILLDSLTVYVNNMIFHSGIEIETSTMATINRLEAKILEDMEAFVRWVDKQDISLMVVTDELGMGIVPENKLTRVYRDMVGKVNQRMATLSDTVFLVVSGISIKIKG